MLEEAVMTDLYRGLLEPAPEDVVAQARRARAGGP